ncbi:MAG: dihydroorotate dehydrogenase (quinone) [bacterium]|nr:dihydroorotate dehydrogenase (quinone) [bacterium]
MALSQLAALVNALGFPGDGMHAVKQRLETLRAAQLSTRPIGSNLGKNAATPIENALDDYADVLSELLDLGDYFVVNVSSPNTVGLRTLQEPDSLRQLLAPLLAITGGKKPLLLKIAPDLTDEDVRTAAQVVTELGLAGIVCANTSIRRNLVPRAASLDRGGLSGAPIFDRMHECLKIVRAELSPQATVIAVGGISSPTQLNQALAAGADLAQIYTAFIYRGPRVIAKLLR